MTRILGISGSLRRGSYNTALLRAGAPLLDAGAELEINVVCTAVPGDEPSCVRRARVAVPRGEGRLLPVPKPSGESLVATAV
jgi:hypothetical protein